MGLLSFIVSLAIVLIFLGIGVTQGFSLEVFAGLLVAGGKFIGDVVREILHP